MPITPPRIHLRFIASLEGISAFVFYVARILLLSLLSLPRSPKVRLKRAETRSRCLKHKTCASWPSTASTLSHVLRHSLHHVREHLSDWINPASTSASLEASPERLREDIVEILSLEKLLEQVIRVEALSLVGLLSKSVVMTSL